MGGGEPPCGGGTNKSLLENKQTGMKSSFAFSDACDDGGWGARRRNVDEVGEGEGGGGR